MKRIVLVLMMILMASVSFGTAIGVKGGYTMYTGDLSDFSGLTFGADVQFGAGPLVIAPEILYSSTSHADMSSLKYNDVGINVNALLKMPVIGIYGGAGIGYHFLTVDNGFISSTTSKLGGQIIAGYQIDIPAFKPFIEARYLKIFEENMDPRIDLLVGVNIGF